MCVCAVCFVCVFQKNQSIVMKPDKYQVVDHSATSPAHSFTFSLRQELISLSGDLTSVIFLPQHHKYLKKTWMRRTGNITLLVESLRSIQGAVGSLLNNA